MKSTSTLTEITPFFVLGSPRSGTSLLSRMLDSHPNLAIPQETLFFKMFYPFLKYYGDLSSKDNQLKLLADVLETRIINYWSPKPQLEDTQALLEGSGCGAVLRALVLASAPDKDLKCWGEKSPGHVFYWKEIQQEFPNAKFIHIVRDGRDVATSLINARMGPKTYVAGANLWREYLTEIEALAAACASDQFLEVRYEDLLNDSQAELERICGFLNIEFSERFYDFHKKTDAYTTDSTNEANLKRPLLKSNKEKWRESMSASDIELFETIAGDQLQAHGYPRSLEESHTSASRIFMLRWMVSPAIRFFYRAKDTKGQAEFLNLQRIKLKRIVSSVTQVNQ